MTSKVWLVAAPVAAGLAMTLASMGHAAEELQMDGGVLFKERCASCHDPAMDRAPTRETMATRPASELIEVMTKGVMQPMADGLTDAQIGAIAQHLTRPPAAQAQGGAAGRPTAFTPKITDQMCATHPPIRTTPTDWNSWGIDERNTRFQRNPGLKASDVPKLKVKWAFSYPGGSYGQPTVVGEHLFITSRGGTFYALDAQTGCVHWKVDNVVARTTPMIEKSDISPSGWVTFIGDRSRVVRAFDAATGKELWKSEPIDDHRTAGITGSPILHKNQLFVPTTSGEEGAGAQPSYECCSFRGALVAMDARTGKVQWKSYAITEPMVKHRKNSQGVQLQGPAGGAIWSAPTIDAKRGLVLVATGDSYIDVPTIGADAIIAYEMATGKVRWQNQVTENDDFIVGCTRVNKPINCSPNPGPDYDFGAPPLLMKMKNGKDIVLAGQKSGIIYGMDPDTGKTLWQTQVGTGSSLGGIEWGLAADDQYVYVPNADIVLLMEEANRAAGQVTLDDRFHGEPRPGLTAINPANGKVVWHTPTPKAPCTFYGDRSRDRAQGCFNASSAAASVIPGVVFSGSTDGWFRAYAAKTGKIIWEHSTTAQTYDTVNGVKGQPGGSIDGMGPVIANGMVFQMSGYNGASNTGGNGTNVILAYSVDGK